MSSFDEEGLEGADDEEWGDAVEREDIGPSSVPSRVQMDLPQRTSS